MIRIKQWRIEIESFENQAILLECIIDEQHTFEINNRCPFTVFIY